VDEVVNAEFLQLQNDGTQVRPQDLRVGIVLHLLLVRLLRVESETLAGARTTSTTSSLLGTSLTDCSHQQRLNTNTRIIHLHIYVMTTYKPHFQPNKSLEIIKIKQYQIQQHNLNQLVFHHHAN